MRRRRRRGEVLVWFHLIELTWDPGEGEQLRTQGSPRSTVTSKSFTVSPPLAANNAPLGFTKLILKTPKTSPFFQLITLNHAPCFPYQSNCRSKPQIEYQLLQNSEGLETLTSSEDGDRARGKQRVWTFQLYTLKNLEIISNPFFFLISFQNCDEPLKWLEN